MDIVWRRICLTSEADANLGKLAPGTGRPESSIVREVLAEHTAKVAGETIQNDNPLARLLTLRADCGDVDGSEEHDRNL